MEDRSAGLCDPWSKLLDQSAFADPCFATHKGSAQPGGTIGAIPERHNPVEFNRSTNKWKNAVIEKIY
jgi:hypothetical protein